MSNTSTPTSKTSNSDEIQLIISTLPKEIGWLADGNNPLYNYQGFWYYGYHLRGAISAQVQEIPGFKNLSPSHILISGNPKCGTTWLKALSFAISTRTRFPIERLEDHPLNSTNPQGLVPMIEQGDEIDPDLCVFSTHIPYTSLPGPVLTSGCKIVYIWRDPKDAFISRWHFAHNIRANKDVTKPISLEEGFDLFCRGITAFGPFWDHVLCYWKAFLDCPDRILFLRYEDLMNDAEVHVKRLADFMGYPFSSVEEKEGVVARIVDMCGFESMKNYKVKRFGDDINSKASFSLTSDAFFRKGQIGDWKNYLTEEMASKIDQITIDKLGTCGLTL